MYFLANNCCKQGITIFLNNYTLHLQFYFSVLIIIRLLGVLVIKPQCMHRRLMVVILSVCVCYRASSYIPGLYVQSDVIYSFL